MPGTHVAHFGIGRRSPTAHATARSSAIRICITRSRVGVAGDHPQTTRPGMLQGCSHATRRRFPSRAAQRSPTAGWVPLCRCTAARAVRWRPGWVST
eukprot:scaffold23228_cov57-Phaeocystis_antarctica.AAC.1